MAISTYDWIERIKAVEREYRVARLATARLWASVPADPNELGTAKKKVSKFGLSVF